MEDGNPMKLEHGSEEGDISESSLESGDELPALKVVSLQNVVCGINLKDYIQLKA